VDVLCSGVQMVYAGSHLTRTGGNREEGKGVQGPWGLMVPARRRDGVGNVYGRPPAKQNRALGSCRGAAAAWTPPLKRQSARRERS
jgi:hypothetical protein